MQQSMDVWNANQEAGDLTIILECQQKEIKRYLVRIMDVQPIIAERELIHLRIVFVRMKPIEVTSYIDEIKRIVRSNWENKLEMLAALERYQRQYTHEEPFQIHAE